MEFRLQLRPSVLRYDQHVVTISSDRRHLLVLLVWLRVSHSCPSQPRTTSSLSDKSLNTFRTRAARNQNVPIARLGQEQLRRPASVSPGAQHPRRGRTRSRGRTATGALLVIRYLGSAVTDTL